MVTSARNRPGQAWGPPPQLSHSSDVEANWNLDASKPRRFLAQRFGSKVSASGPCGGLRPGCAAER